MLILPHPSIQGVHLKKKNSNILTNGKQEEKNNISFTGGFYCFSALELWANICVFYMNWFLAFTFVGQLYLSETQEKGRKKQWNS